MAKAKKEIAVSGPTFLDSLTHDEYVARYQANQAEIKALREENALIHDLDIAAKKNAKTNKTSAKLAALEAQLAKLRGEEVTETVAAETSEVLAM